jgi:putative cardiolipin synthase
VAVIDSRQVFIGSLNLDLRSAWSNTEAGLLIASPALAHEIEGLIGRDRLASVYQLRLGADGESIEWVETAADGTKHVLKEEPHDSWLHRLKMFLISPFAPEDLL